VERAPICNRFPLNVSHPYQTTKFQSKYSTLQPQVALTANRSEESKQNKGWEERYVGKRRKSRKSRENGAKGGVPGGGAGGFVDGNT